LTGGSRIAVEMTAALMADVMAYRPAANLLFWLEYRIGGRDPVLYNLDQLLIHWLNACLVLCLSLAVFGSSVGAMLAAALFALHPINAYAATNPAARGNTLFGLFYLLALLVDPTLTDPMIYESIVLLAILGVSIIMLRSRAPAEAFVIALFLVTLSPLLAVNNMSGTLSTQQILAQERWIYLPGIAAFLMLGRGGEWVYQRLKASAADRIAAAATVASICVLLGRMAGIHAANVENWFAVLRQYELVPEQRLSRLERANQLLLYSNLVAVPLGHLEDAEARSRRALARRSDAACSAVTRLPPSQGGPSPVPPINPSGTVPGPSSSNGRSSSRQPRTHCITYPCRCGKYCISRRSWSTLMWLTQRMSFRRSGSLLGRHSTKCSLGQLRHNATKGRGANTSA
jgi:hypothetical protein